MTTGSYTYDAALATKMVQRHNVVNGHSSISSWVEAAGRLALNCIVSPCPAATLSG